MMKTVPLKAFSGQSLHGYLNFFFYCNALSTMNMILRVQYLLCKWSWSLWNFFDRNFRKWKP